MSKVKNEPLHQTHKETQKQNCSVNSSKMLKVKYSSVLDLTFFPKKLLYSSNDQTILKFHGNLFLVVRGLSGHTQFFSLPIKMMHSFLYTHILPNPFHSFILFSPSPSHPLLHPHTLIYSLHSFSISSTGLSPSSSP